MIARGHSPTSRSSPYIDNVHESRFCRHFRGTKATIFVDEEPQPFGSAGSNPATGALNKCALTSSAVDSNVGVGRGSDEVLGITFNSRRVRARVGR
jgi:hypothetical protein